MSMDPYFKSLLEPWYLSYNISDDVSECFLRTVTREGVAGKVMGGGMACTQKKLKC